MAYKQIDINNDGLISFHEFIEFCQKRLRLKLSKPELYELWRQLDLNGSGVVSAASPEGLNLLSSRRALLPPHTH